MRCARRWPELCAALIALAPGVAAAQGPWDPSEATVPWTGAPAPVEGRTVGGALSPHGSHVGLKAVLDGEAAVPAGALGAVAVHDARSTSTGRLAVVSVVVESREGEPMVATDPHATFAPWGFSIESQVAGVPVTLRFVFAAADAFVVAVDLGGLEGAVAVLRMEPGAAIEDGSDALVELAGATFAVGATRVFRPVDAEVGGALRVPASGGPVALMIGFGDDAPQARSARDRGWAAFPSRDPERAWTEEAARFEADAAAALCSEDGSPEAERIRRVAVAALRSSAYGPRGLLESTLLSAAKSFDNGFLGSDLPRQAEALAAQDPALALGALEGQLAAMADDSHVPYRFDDRLTRDPLPNGSMPPVQAQAFVRVLAAGGELDAGRRLEIVRRLVEVAAWWPTNRDQRRAGLLVHGSAEEAGRPGTTRWPGSGDRENAASYFEAPDLAVTYADYLDSLAELAEGIEDVDTASLRARADEQHDRVLDELWNDDRGFFVDQDVETGELSAVIGPHGLVPIAAGLLDEEDDLARALDGVLLRPDGLWGDDDGPRLPVPEVAWDTPGLDRDATPSWLEDMETALRALARHGRGAEAERLAERIVSIVASHPEGVYDRYWSGTAPDARPPVLQSGRAAAILLGILHRDHERERTLGADERAFEGRVARAWLPGGTRLLEVAQPGPVPRLRLSAVRDEPLDDLGTARLEVLATCDLAEGTAVAIGLPGLAPFQWEEEGTGASGRSNELLVARAGQAYVIEPLRLRGGGCSVAPSGPVREGWIVLLVVLVLRAGARARGIPKGRRGAGRAVRGRGPARRAPRA